MHVQGQQFDLEGLREILPDGDPSIIQDGSNFYLTSAEWNQSDNAREIHVRAEEFIELLEDVAYIHFRHTVPLTIGGVVRVDENGLKHHVIIAAHGTLNATLQAVRLRATGTVGGPEKQAGEVRHEHPVVKLLSAAKRNSNVKDALKFYRKGDWISLYKAYELVSDEVCGKREIISRKWISATSLDRFSQMAQSRAGLGDDARHASKKYKPPAKSISLTEAKNIIGTLLQNWINSL